MAISSEKDKQQFVNRLKELARRSYEQNMYTFTPMLDMMEQTIYWNMIEELSFAGTTIYGGREMSERNMVRFGNPKEFGYEEEFPISLIHIKPLLSKFADELNHRDFLGALMNLGIERSLLGDIVVGDKEAYLFCQTSIVDFICEHLQKIKHTNVRCIKTDTLGEYQEVEPIEEVHSVSSERIDVVVAKVYNLSRSQVITLFREKRVFVSSRLCENNSRFCKKDDVIQVRGFGKFTYHGFLSQTKKMKLRISISIFK